MTPVQIGGCVVGDHGLAPGRFWRAIAGSCCLALLSLAFPAAAQEYRAHAPRSQQEVRSVATWGSGRQAAYDAGQESRRSAAPRHPLQVRTVSQASPAAKNDSLAAAPIATASRASGACDSLESERRSDAAPLPLARPRTDSAATKAAAASGTAPRSLATWTIVCFITAGACVLLWLTRRGSSATGGQLPDEAFELLGKATPSPRLEVHLIRIGGKLVLVGSTAQSHQALCEITDREEVDRLIAACGAERGTNIAASMRRALAQLDRPTASVTESRARRAAREIADA